MGIDVVSSMGFHRISPNLKESEKEARKIINIANALSYLPVIGMVIGLARMILMGTCRLEVSQDPGYEKRLLAYHFTRGIIETLCVGILFFILDMIASIGRAAGKWI